MADLHELEAEERDAKHQFGFAELSLRTAEQHLRDDLTDENVTHVEQAKSAFERAAIRLSASQQRLVAARARQAAKEHVTQLDHLAELERLSGFPALYGAILPSVERLVAIWQDGTAAIGVISKELAKQNAQVREAARLAKSLGKRTTATTITPALIQALIGVLIYRADHRQQAPLLGEWLTPRGPSGWQDHSPAATTQKRAETLLNNTLAKETA